MGHLCRDRVFLKTEMEQSTKKRWMMRYLLQQMTDEERLSVESMYIDKDELFEELLEGENSMLDAYVRGNVSAEERQLIEQHYLTTPERRDRVAFARSLLHLRNRRQAKIKSGAATEFLPVPGPGGWGRVWGISLACVSVLALLAAGWLVRENLQLREELQAVRADLARSAQQQWALEREVEALKTPPKQDVPEVRNAVERLAAGTVALALSPVSLRGVGDGNTLRIGPSASTAQLTLLDPVSFPMYQVIIETAEGSAVWNQTGIRKSRESVVIVVPVKSLSAGDYIVRLRGMTGNPPQNAGDYSLRVVKR